jgi:regulator of protease activity HflC (stomatin/prohibitin superfamily)
MEIIAQLQIYLGILIIFLLILSQAVKILREYERGVIFRLGRLVGAKGPGLILLIPIVDRIVRVSLRIITMDVPAQEVITRDTVPVKVNAVIYFRVVNPENAVVEIENFVNATSQIAQTTLRSVLGQMELDEILSQREKINQTLQKIVDEHTGPWGIKVTAVETKDIELPEGMKRAMAKQAEAERERRAKIIHAEGEYQASEKLVKAADRIAKEPIALTLRYLQTLTEVATEKNSTTLFPIPIDLIKPFLEKLSPNESKKK